MAANYLIKGPITLKEMSQYFEKLEAHTDTGGHSVFLGQVRADTVDGKKVKAIEYSAYDAMVSTEGDKIKNAILKEFCDTRTVDIVHSTGIVNAGEISLFVLVSARHRQQAIQACARAVELIKEKLPVWKKELYEDNSYEWQKHSV
jgi:molybdopterin synthase catalytic subunit